jgi:hypothetical protein
MVDLPTAGRFVGGAGYAPLTDTSLRALVSGIPVCRDLLKGDPTDWEIWEVGDGNLNLVFIVTSGRTAWPSSRRCPTCAWLARAGHYRLIVPISSMKR